MIHISGLHPANILAHELRGEGLDHQIGSDQHSWGAETNDHWTSPTATSFFSAIDGLLIKPAIEIRRTKEAASGQTKRNCTSGVHQAEEELGMWSP